MFRPLRHPVAAARRDRRGVILPLAAVLLVLVFAFLAFSIDVGFMAVTKGELQNAADAGALAGAAELPDGRRPAVTEAIVVAGENDALNETVTVPPSDVTTGFWDVLERTFDPAAETANAVRVVTRKRDAGLMFAPVIGVDTFSQRAEAIAVIRPRDICFVVDLSGSMNDDTEPVWATDLIDAKFAAAGYPTIGTELAETLFEDLGFGPFPGRVQHLGGGLVPEDDYAYANLTKDDGILANPGVPARYRIAESDDERTRKRKCYSALIDYQLRPLMPGVSPPADSRSHYEYWEKYLDYLVVGRTVGVDPPAPPSPPGPPPSNGGGGEPPKKPKKPKKKSPPSPPPPPPRPTVGWLEEAFPPGADPGDAARAFLTGHLASLAPAPRAAGAALADLNGLHGAAAALAAATAGAAGDPEGTPRRGSTYRSEHLPPDQDGDRIVGMNNPNDWSFPGASGGPVDALRNKLGFLTYAQFLQDFGRDRSPEYGNDANADPGLGGKVPLSLGSPYARLHTESVGGRSFQFPPRTQPMHALRRGLIAGLDTIYDHNRSGSPAVRDWVSVVTFDGLGPYHEPTLAYELGPDFPAAMEAVSKLQAVGDVGATTALDPAVLLAQEHLSSPQTSGGAGRGRAFAEKVIVIVSDGIPNAWTTDESAVAAYRAALGGDAAAGEFYAAGATWLNAPLMHTHRWAKKGTTVAVGMGLGADHDYADRLARLADTADPDGRSPRTSGNPAMYEAELRRIFDEYLRPDPKLVK